ncbi:MAG: KH domain-containing protein [Myxococcales bacterium]|nr:KH domain-containing protein [Myxococcales bacterium]
MDAEQLCAWINARLPDPVVENVERQDGASDEPPTYALYTRRPGIIIGKRAARLTALKEAMEAELGPLRLNIVELRR